MWKVSLAYARCSVTGTATTVFALRTVVVPAGERGVVRPAVRRPDAGRVTGGGRVRGAGAAARGGQRAQRRQASTATAATDRREIMRAG